MGTEAIDFAGLLCARLCHDLLSPIGALGNGLELLAQENDPEMQAQCLDLLAQSSRAALNKLKFFRLAFGAAGGLGDLIDVPDLYAAMSGIFPTSKNVKIVWHIGAPQVSKPTVKLLLNLGLIVGEALVKGGQLDLALEQRGTRTEIVVRGEGERIVLDPAIRQTLEGDRTPDPLSPRLAPAWMVAQIARTLGPGLQVSPPDASYLLIGAALATGPARA